jgi:transcription antitermination protein NusB
MTTTPVKKPPVGSNGPTPSRSVRGIGKRRMAREMALQMLYQSDLGDGRVAEIVASFDVVDYLRQQAEAATESGVNLAAVGDGRLAEARRAFEHATALLAGARDRLEEIDGLIREQAEHWRLERMPPVDRNILRLAIYELLCETDVPQLVILDEAVELAKRFGSEQSGRFVNGLLDGLLRRHGIPGRET